jgi:geranylgeranyl diphosphate synthase, type II
MNNKNYVLPETAQAPASVDISFFAEKIAHTLSTISYGDKPAELYDPIRYIMQLGGKRLRPLVTVLAGYLFHDDIQKCLKPACGVEVFHNFTLLHDDIMDKAPLRRGQPTVHEKWNHNIAILSGDVMMVRAYELFLEVEPAKLQKVLKLFSNCAAAVCEGQQLDMNFETQDYITIDDYLHMITLKTAVLLGFSLELGAILNGAPDKEAILLKRFGINVGIAFQLRDDLLDVYGDQNKFGKQVGGDILADKKTFLLLTALTQASESQRDILTRFREKTNYSAEEKVREVTQVYNDLDIRTQTETIINKYFEEAIQSLDAVKAPEDRKALLRNLALQLMERES